MPKNRNVKEGINRDGLESGSGVERGSGLSGNANSSINGTGSGSNSGFKNTSASRQNRGSPKTQFNLNLDDLDSLTQTTREVLQYISKTQEKVKNLSDLYTRRASDIEEVSKIHQRCSERRRCVMTRMRR